MARIGTKIAVLMWSNNLKSLDEGIYISGCCFKRGYKRALEDLWHPAKEKPKDDMEFIFEHKGKSEDKILTIYSSTVWRKEWESWEVTSWKARVARWNVTQWIYVEDILQRLKVMNIIDDKKIEAAARRYSKVTDCDKEESLLIQEGFTEGAKWAINKFLKDLWHSTGEKPKKGCVFLYKTIFNGYGLNQIIDGNEWEYIIKYQKATQWLYIDDLFPKEGGENEKE